MLLNKYCNNFAELHDGISYEDKEIPISTNHIGTKEKVDCGFTFKILSEQGEAVFTSKWLSDIF